MSSEQLKKAVVELAGPVAEAHGLELVEVELAPGAGRTVLRLILDREGGITIDDLAEMSREMGDVLDAHDAIAIKYTLECSSPGVNRPLKTPADFLRFCGKEVALRTSTTIEGARNFAGLLLTAGEDGIEIEDRSHGRLRVPYGLIQKANYEHDFARDFRGERD